MLLYLLKNPFGLRNPYEKLNREIYLHQLIASDIGKYLQKVYPEIDLTNIFNYIGCGKVYNLPESKIIVGNNNSVNEATYSVDTNPEKDLILRILNAEPDKMVELIKKLVVLACIYAREYVKSWGIKLAYSHKKIKVRM